MPIYEYRCAACGFQNEYLQKVSEPLLTVCPQCGKETFKKLLTAAGFQLKGSGWYATDFKGAGAKPAEAKPDGAGKRDDKGGKSDGGDKGDKGESKDAAPACGAGACSACS
ncbi:MAG: zinc ribbon domain-containing protein [Burkholderiales bacterium]